jgi:phosphoglycerol transferase MdoB-like AlkP superfamily enzyme
MTNSENFEHTVEESSVSFWPTAIRYGLIGGLVLVVYTLIGNMTGFTIPSSIMGGLILMVIGFLFIIGIAMFAIKAHRDQDLKGNISFLRAFLVGLVALVIAGLISSAFNVLYMTIIDPNYVDNAMEKMEEMFTSLGMDESMMETQLEAARERMTIGSMIKNGLLWGNVLNAVFAAIIAAIMKRMPAPFKA